MQEIKGSFDHHLRFRTHLGDGTYGEAKVSLSICVSGQAVFVEFKNCPSVMFKTKDCIAHAYDMLEKEGYMKDGKRTKKEYNFNEACREEIKKGGKK